MFRASVDSFRGYGYHAYAETEARARELLGRFILAETEQSFTTVDEVDEYFGINTEPVLEGVFCESHPEHNLSEE